MNPRSVLHVWQAAYPWEVRVGKINRALSSRARVTVLARKATSAEYEGTRVRSAGPAGPLSLPAPGSPVWARALRQAIREEQVDLVIVRDIPLAGLAIAEARRAQIPVVLDMAEHYPAAMRTWKKYSQNPLLRAMVHDWRLPDHHEASVMKGLMSLPASAVWVVCEEQRERLVREYGFPRERIELVLNTPELAKLPAFVPPSGRPPGGRFGYHGILCDDRELEVILRGFDRFVASQPEAARPGLSLLLAGGGESETQLRALKQGLAHGAQIEMTGRYRPEDLQGLYDRVDYGVVALRASVFTEHTLANKFFDYAALGKPFVYPKLAPLERVMSQLRCGVGFEPGSEASVTQAFESLLQAPYVELAKSGRAAIERELNWMQDSERLLASLQKL